MGNTNYTLYADSLDRFYSNIMDIFRRIRTKDNRFPVLWFRGHEYINYNLVPSLFRDTKYIINDEKTYSNNHMREDYRYQHFMARNYNLLDCTDPNSLIEWQEIMQHHFAKTRLMDWSESAQIALLFALEPFINSASDMELENKRRTASPVVWILNAAEINRRIYQHLIYIDSAMRYPLIEGAFKGLVPEEQLVDLSIRIGKELSKAPEVYWKMTNEKEYSMNAIFSLSALENLRRSYIGREVEAVERFEFNPFFYLMLRYYSDGVPVDFNKLPPLAIIHPYHTQRIRAQKGAFTVYPYYIPTETEDRILNMGLGINPISMEYMASCQDLIYKIVITDPERTAKELKLSGERRGNLYPEMQVFSQDLENGNQVLN